MFWFGFDFYQTFKFEPPVFDDFTRRVRESDLNFIKTSAFDEFGEGSGAAMRRPEPF